MVTGRQQARLLLMTVVTASTAALSVCAQPSGPAAAVPADSAQAAQKDLQSNAELLMDPASRQDQRDQAAERLVRRRTIDAKQVLLVALQESRNRGAQLAVAKALALEAIPDPDYIPALLGLMGRIPDMTEAASQALANYNRDPRVLDELLRFVKNTNQVEKSRMAAIRALGSFLDKNLTATLIGFLGDPRETSSVRTAATDALGEITGLQQYGHDIGQWQRWWAAEGSLQKEDEFRETQLNRRIGRYALVKREYQRLVGDIKSLLNRVYDSTPPEQRTERVLSWLKDGEPAIRAVAADVVQQQKAAGQRIAPEVIEQLRQMVGDSAVNVRLSVVTALKEINDAGAVDSLLTQLAVETDADVKAEIAHTLAREQNLKAVDAMLRQLADPSSRVAEAAAECLRDMGPLIRKDRDLTHTVVTGLSTSLEGTLNNPGDDLKRGAIAEALAALHDESVAGIFYRLTSPSRDNTVRVRIAACRGLGEMESPAAREGAAQALARVVNNDLDQGVRLAAVIALGKVGTFDQADTVFKVMNPRYELDSSVREAAWDVLRKLLVRPDATSSQLSIWPGRFQNDPEKRLVALKAWRDKLVSDAGVPALRDRALRDLAGVQENIGATLLKSLNRPDEAALSFQAALDYWLSVHAPRATTTGLIEAEMTSLLQAKKYLEAGKFAGERIDAAPQDQETMGLAIRNEVERLRTIGDLKNAKSLVDQASRIHPQLTGIYADAIRQLGEQIDKKLQP